MSKPQILVIEDPSLTHFHQQMQAFGDVIDMETATLGQPAIQCLRENSFDAIFIDMSHDDFDVLEISRQMIAMACSAMNTITIVIISDVYLNYIAKLQTLTVTEVLAAPLHQEDLKMVIINHFPETNNQFKGSQLYQKLSNGLQQVSTP